MTRMWCETVDLCRCPMPSASGEQLNGTPAAYTFSSDSRTGSPSACSTLTSSMSSASGCGSRSPSSPMPGLLSSYCLTIIQQSLLFDQRQTIIALFADHLGDPVRLRLLLLALGTFAV